MFRAPPSLGNTHLSPGPLLCGAEKGRAAYILFVGDGIALKVENFQPLTPAEGRRILSTATAGIPKTKHPRHTFMQDYACTLTIRKNFTNPASYSTATVPQKVTG